MSGRGWSDAEAALVRRRYAEGAADKDIAAELGRTRGAVRDWRVRHGVLGRRQRSPDGRAWSPGEEARLREMVAAGVDDDACAAALARPVGGIRQRRRALGLYRDNPVTGDVPVRPGEFGRGGAKPGGPDPLRLPPAGARVVRPDDCVLAERAMLAVMRRRGLPVGP